MSDRTVLRSPADVVAAVPSLLGFHPHDDLVALWTNPADGSLVCTMRFDLATPLVEVQRRLHDLAVHTGSGRIIAVAYPDDPAWSGSDLLDACGELADVTVADLLIVADGVYRSELCTNPDCCPPEGQPVPVEVPQVAAELVHAGWYAPADTRDDVAARYQLRPDLSPSTEALETARDGLPLGLGSRCDLALQLVATLATDPGGDCSAAAGLMLLMQAPDVRDWVLVHVASPQPDQPGVEVLVHVALTAPEVLRPRVAGAAAAALYAAQGTSVGVWALIDHADGDSLARLVAGALDAALPPTTLIDAFTEALPQLQERIDRDTVTQAAS